MHSMSLEKRAAWKWRYHQPNRVEGWVSWKGVLPRCRGEEDLHTKLKRVLQAAIRRLPEDFPAHVIEAIRRWWPIRPIEKAGVEMYLVRPDGSRKKMVIYRKVIRIGRAESCHIQLTGKTVSGEHCEIRNDDGTLSIMDLNSTNGTVVNGKPIPAMKQWPLRKGDEVSIPPYRIVIGASDIAFGDPEMKFEPTQCFPISGPEDLAMVEGPEMLWSHIGGQWFEGYLGIPYPWRKLAYRSLQLEPPVDDDAVLTEVDRALTSFLLSGTVREIASLSGLEVDVTGVFGAGSRFSRFSPPEGAVVSLFDCEIGGVRTEVPLVWWLKDAVAEQSSVLEIFGDVSFFVGVEGGFLKLSYSDFQALEAGDIVLPDAFPCGESMVQGSVTGPVWLVCQHWAAHGQLLTGDNGHRLEMNQSWQLIPGGRWMNGEHDEQTPEQREPIAVPDELEVTLVFELARIEVPLKELAGWEEGAVVELDRTVDTEVDIVLHQGRHPRMIGRGRVVELEGRIGIEITEWHVRRASS